MSPVVLANVRGGLDGIVGDRRACDRSEPRQEQHRDLYSLTLAVFPARIVRIDPLAGRRRPRFSDLTCADRTAMSGRHFAGCAGLVFLVVVKLGGASASLYGLATAHPRTARNACCLFFPAYSGRDEPGGAGGLCVFLSALLGIHVAASWRWLMATIRGGGQRQCGLLLSRDGELRQAGVAAGVRRCGTRRG